MIEDEKELRERIGQVAADYIAAGDAFGWFEELYSEADGDIDAIPWLDLEPNRFLVEWDKGTLANGAGKPALVIGCGLGDEAEYLDQRGYRVTAFDISASAIKWARRIHAQSNIEFMVADMFDPPAGWIGRFDLVMEVYTIQALPLDLRARTIEAIGSFVTNGGELVAVQRLRAVEEREPDGPPWAVSRDELSRFEQIGFKQMDFCVLPGDEDEPIERFVAHLRKEKS